ncbi:MAG: hypothetical protein ACYS1A_19750 [Planctomycetota bacterium]|jgi:hypothetical protein
MEAITTFDELYDRLNVQARKTMAELLGVTDVALWKWRKFPTRQPRLEHVVKLRDTYGVSVDSWLERS